MAQARVGDSGIQDRKNKIAVWESQVAVWELMLENSPGMNKLREATKLAVEKMQEEIVDRVKTLSFASDADRLDLAKMAGKLDGYKSIYYDIADAKKKIEGAKAIIAKLADEIRRAKKGELLETKA